MSDEATQTALREMAGQIGALTSTVGSLERNWMAQDAKASAGRAVTYQKLDDLKSEFDGWRAKLETVIVKVAAMEPTVNEINQAKQRAIGAFWVSRMFYGIGIIMTAGVTYVLANWIKISIK